MSKDTIKIIEPSKEIFGKINGYIEMVQSILPSSKITLIGSFAIPMCGKEEFDLLVETDDVVESQNLVEQNSNGIFGKGPVVGDEAYSRSKKKYGIICELHFLPKKTSKFSTPVPTSGNANPIFFSVKVSPFFMSSFANKHILE